MGAYFLCWESENVVHAITNFCSYLTRSYADAILFIPVSPIGLPPKLFPPGVAADKEFAQRPDCIFMLVRHIPIN